MVDYSPTLANNTDFIQFNSSDQLVVDTGTLVVLTYPHPKNGQLGQPLKSTTLGEAGGQYVFVRALSGDGKTLFATPLYQPNVYMYHYPEGGPPFQTVQTAAKAPGAAANPPLTP